MNPPAEIWAMESAYRPGNVVCWLWINTTDAALSVLVHDPIDVKPIGTTIVGALCRA